MKLFARALLVALGACSVLACSAKRLPPGTPPPEYEMRMFEPWPPVQAPDAGVSPAPVAAPLDAGTGGEAEPTAPKAPIDPALGDAGTPPLSPSGS